MLPVSQQDKAALFAQAQRQHAAGQFEKARESFQKLLVSDPDLAPAHAFLSTICYELGHTDDFLNHTDRALALAPSSTRLWQVAADRFARIGMSDRALSAYDQLIALDPRAVAPKADKARYLQVLGRFDEASEALRKLIKRHPNQPELYRIYMGATKARKGDPMIRQMLRLWKDPRLNDTGHVYLGFALAKAMEDIGETDKVFGYLKRANSAQAKLAVLDPGAKDREVTAVLAAQSGDLTPVGPPMDHRPVFVTGMPRSGTTLVEQIIAAHSDANAGGEMPHAMKHAYLRFGAAEKMRSVAGIDTADLAEYSALYSRLARRDAGKNAAVITDKSIQTYLIFGLIHRAMPGARFVVVHRDPRDIALSIYKNYFAIGTHRYANDLAQIAYEIKRFRRVVAHWKTLMPEVIHEVNYEDLVSDPDPHARRLIAAAGLDWQDQCLSFHEQKGAVQTLSLAQVRQPIHSGRREAWRKYETQLEPFISAWGSDPWD